jgi:hypothetical protein
LSQRGSAPTALRSCTMTGKLNDVNPDMEICRSL